jgi:glucuronoarabinoxylan endo-1,4-beta-xylanase
MTKFEKLPVLRISFAIFSLFGLSFVSSCGGDDEEPVTPPEPESDKITVNLSTTYQEMIGFGGALTWYSDRVISSSKKTEISNLIFNDLGADIIRLKTWYYPDNYPTVTSTASMSDDNSKAMLDVTNQLQQLAKTQNPNVKILLSSWGPPAGLKSNNSSRQGTLKKDGDAFMYDAYATYWENTLNNLGFNPEYISIQNEPTYTNAGWTTCKWSVTETAELPSYITAFDKVYDKIKTRTNPPIMLGPESQDIPTFGAFAEALKDKPHAGVLGYHPYNITESTPASTVESGLKSIANFTTKPNMLTEYSDNLQSWFNTAIFIQKTLLYANSSGYIYWKLAWDQPASGEDAGMVSINAAGNYKVTPYYHVIKHFAKHIDAGYKRVAVESTNKNLLISAFVNPAQTKVTLVIINNSPSDEMKFEVTGKTIKAIAGNQTKDGSTDYFKALEGIDPASKVTIPAKTISTMVLDL